MVPNKSVVPIVPGDFDMSTFEQIKKAYAAHTMWKTRLRRAIDEGDSEFTVDRVSVGNQWNFGASFGASICRQAASQKA